MIASQPATLVVSGSGFATGSTPTAWLSACSAPPGIVAPTTPFALPAIAGATATQLSVAISASTMAAGVVCTLRIVNGAPANATNPCPAGGACLPFTTLTPWNNGGGGTPNIPRVLLNTVVEAPFIYIFGGSTTAAATSATASTERTVW